MQATIRHGRVLREILKQDRLEPLPVRHQLAWLVAFNDGLFDEVELAQIPARLAALQRAVEDSELTLDSPRQQWSEAVSGWLQAAGAAGTAEA
jgi:F-type H+-transporting ATPase subunit alpha